MCGCWSWSNRVNAQPAKLLPGIFGLTIRLLLSDMSRRFSSIARRLSDRSLSPTDIVHKLKQSMAEVTPQLHFFDHFDKFSRSFLQQLLAVGEAAFFLHWT